MIHLCTDNFQCSCYTFDGRPKSWSYGRQQCRTQGGDLVSMETVEEWELINTQIQNRTAGNFDEWWIGLEKRDGRWVWLSNHTLTYNKWQPHEPSNRTNEKCSVMAKNYPANKYGLFGDTRCDLWRGWICEYKIKVTANCNETQVSRCSDETTPVTSITESTTTPDQKTKLTSESISTTVIQPTSKTTMTYPNVKASSTKTMTDKERIATSKYSIPTTPYQKDTKMPTTTETDKGTTATDVSLTTKKPLPTLTIIIAILVVVLVVFLCCVVLCVYGWNLKRKGKPKTRVKHDETNTEHNTSDVMAGSSSGLQVSEHELKVIVIQPNNACAQKDSHATTHGNALDKSNATKEVTSCLVSHIIHDALEMRKHNNMTSLESTGKDSSQNKDKADHSNPTDKSPQEESDLPPDDTVDKENTKVPDICATVGKSKKKSKITEADQRQDLVTYAELAEFNHDATQSVPKVPPPYQPTEYASVSNITVRSQTK
ncbi:cell wall protein DAN4-like isoform X2 [Actinia tenebrosa]|uniref:Cell wall protein DAN4-like isoform X2 n=1 Tax=Actinia tenebrosa TaxID=6105 RepID=A0A6P8H1S2_ACTTE|nr:cell wall protein DAN4-like isoform X2 [Actinia tenebrosa]